MEEFTTAIRLTESRRQLLIELIKGALSDFSGGAFWSEDYKKERRKMLEGILEQLTDGDD